MTSLLLMALVAQCGPSGCPAPARYAPYAPYALPAYMPAFRSYEPPQQQPAPGPQYEWIRIKHDGLSFYVWGYPEGTQAVWSRNLPENVANYRKAAEAARAARPVVPPKAQATPVNYGVDPTKRELVGEHYTANSTESRSFVTQARADADSKSHRIYLTVIGAPDDRKGIADDWKGSVEFEPWKEKVWFQEYARGDWQVKDDLGYQAGGRPTILVQKPGGEVVLRATSYSGPSPVLAALRKADPDYKPADDPGPGDGPADEDSLGLRPWAALFVVIVGAVIFIPTRRRACPVPT